MNKNYTLNEHGVCMNPDKLILCDDKDFHCEIRTAFIKDKWCLGTSYHMNFGSHHGASGPVSYGWKMFDSQEEAISVGIDRIKSIAESDLDRDGNREKYHDKFKALFRILDAAKAPQLELF